MNDAELELRPLTPAERPLLTELLTRAWGAPEIVSRGRVYDGSAARTLAAFTADQVAGLATYALEDGECVILTLNAFEAGRGIGSALLAAVADLARSAGCRRLWLVTSNDNATAIRFYERSGMRLAAIHRGAMDEARRLKPVIPELAPDGTRISDEVEFELEL